MRMLTVRHVTVYRYSEPVKLGEHRMMFRPRESHDLRLVQHELDIRPYPASLRWLHDVFDNSIAIATFDGTTVELRFDSTVTLEHIETALPDYALEIEAQTYPFTLLGRRRPDLARALIRRYPGDEVSAWAARFLSPTGSTDTMALLDAMTLGIRNEFTYVRRPEKGVQRPEDTLRLRSGSCRDFARVHDGSGPLARSRRAVRQRLHLRAGGGPSGHGRAAGRPTPGCRSICPAPAGSISIRPTASSGNRNLIRVAVAWDHGQALPLWGSFIGAASSFLGMDVERQRHRGPAVHGSLQPLAPAPSPQPLTSNL